jgi:hypothetical protein
MQEMGASYGSIASGVGEGASAINNREAVSKAAGLQREALAKINIAITRDMDPAVVNELVKKYDTESAKNRLALQAQIDPLLAQQRTTSQQKISDQLALIGVADSDRVAAQAAKEAMSEIPGMSSGIAGLTKAANEQLALKSSMSPDVQAELMQAGLQQAGSATGAATARGAGGVILQQVLGSAGIKLRAERETQAAALMTAASNLDAQRQQLLTGLFPRLQAQQLGNISASQSILKQSNEMMPNAGMSGTQVANLWLARLGALNANVAASTNVEAGKVLGKAAAMGQLAGSFGTALGGSGSQGGTKTSAGLSSLGALDTTGKAYDYGGELS